MIAAFAIHGGRLAEARARFGGAAEDWLDLSTGINPQPWTPPAALAVDWRALPDRAALTHLEAVAGQHFGADPALCAAVPGSEAALRLLGHALGLSGLRLPLAYGTYGAAFPSSEPLQSLDCLPARPTVLVLGNPNNPDGAITPREQLLALLAHQERHGGWLIVDEAFADCTPGHSLAAEVGAHRRLIVLRSFGKFFGLAGLRLGFVLAPRAVHDALARLLGDWPVNAAAIALGTAAYADQAWIAATRRALPSRAAALDTVLRRHGLEPTGRCPLFRLVHTPDAARLFAALARQHILVRPFAAHPALLRLGLPGSDAALARLDAALSRANG